MELIDIGKIWASHNLRGTVKIMTTLEDIYFLIGEKVIVKKYKGNEIVLTVKFIKQTAPNKWIVDFEHITDRDAADSLRNGIIRITKDLIPEKKSEKITNYLGMKAINIETDAALGTVTDFFTTPTYNILVVEDNIHEILIPNISKFLKKIDVEKNSIYVELLDGMIELKKKKRGNVK
ncbi:MAG: ribosome maturation factor RimM [Fusobacteriaceae bacterium]|jgi:16S rRNA processing protein RimM|nr:ribosome maturation factor RimM [Fusobacteriaceae bacterium]